MFVLSWLTARGSAISSLCFNTDTLSPAHSTADSWYDQNSTAWYSIQRHYIYQG